MVLQPVKCPNCGSVNVIRHGNASNGKQRYSCKNKGCERVTFIQNYSDKGRLPEVKEKIIEMSVNASGIRDTARVLGISTTTVINELNDLPTKIGRLLLG
ncbi:MAG: InsA N-terminal domain-containing protein [Candidatus Kentron sp. G]|nr:MAG: InsA N-terminal domain-containing protein [Candidatus Kentron sp. G]